MLRRLSVWVDGWAELDQLRAEFPTVELGILAGPVPQGPEVIHAATWWQPCPETDRRIEGPYAESGPESIAVVAESPEEGSRLAMQVLTRYQHRIGRRNQHSRGTSFDHVLKRHRHLHELSHLFVRADYVHSLDVWQWLLRLQPAADLALQIAALFHDVERPIVEPASRSDPVGPSYQLLKDAHARASARLTRIWLANLDLPGSVLRAAEVLIEGHERQGISDQQVLLNQADALSFISRGTETYPASLLSWRLRRALTRLREDGLARLAHIRCAPEVSRVLEMCTAASSTPELQLVAL